MCKDEKCTYCKKDKRHNKCEKKEKKKHCPKKEKCEVDCKLLKELECLWKKFTCDVDAHFEHGVANIAHTLPLKAINTINGLPVKSPLTTHGLYSAECSCEKYVNLYEIIIPDIPGCHGEDSTGKIFVKILAKHGIYADGDHFHWKGHIILKEQALPDAIHVVGIDIHPVYFTKVIIKALRKVLCITKQRIGH